MVKIEEWLKDKITISFHPESKQKIINLRIKQEYEYYKLGLLNYLWKIIKSHKLAKLYSIILILLFILYQGGYITHNYYVYSQKEMKRMSKQIMADNSVLKDIDRFYPGVGSGAKEIISKIIDDNYKIEKDKIIDPFVEEKTKIALQLHGLKNYQLRLDDFIFPVKDINKSFIQCPENEFGWRKISWKQNKDFHTGLDIYTYDGSDVIASNEGIVKWTGSSEKGGLFIIIRHYIKNGYLDTYYGHLFEIGVKEGQVVRKREVIGTMGSTGTDCSGRHVHFEIRYYIKIGDTWKVFYYNPVKNSTWGKEVEENKIL